MQLVFAHSGRAIAAMNFASFARLLPALPGPSCEPEPEPEPEPEHVFRQCEQAISLIFRIVLFTTTAICSATRSATCCSSGLPAATWKWCSNAAVTGDVARPSGLLNKKSFIFCAAPGNHDLASLNASRTAFSACRAAQLSPAG